MVSSTNISYFNAGIQNHLHEMYTSIKDFNTVFSDARARVVTGGGPVFKPASLWSDHDDNTRKKNTPDDDARVGLLDGVSTWAEAAICKVDAFRRSNKPVRWLQLLKALHWYYDD